jgi:UV DNA damage endonuclease
MKIGYPCINRTVGCSGNKTFRLKSFSEDRLIQTIDNNLDCLLKILKFNVLHNILFFRITSDLVPFASHPICTYNWQNHFKLKFQEIGSYIKEKKLRISMHPDQFIVLNSINPEIVDRSIAELKYHAQVLDLMNLDNTAKIQLHVGGVYKNKQKSLERFCENYNSLEKSIKSRLVIENDHRSYCLKDCLKIHEKTGIPVLFDVFHNKIFNCIESIQDSYSLFSDTWDKDDGIPMIDYSSQEPGKTAGVHAETIDKKDFLSFLETTKSFDFDIMFEIKDKDKSVLRVIDIVKSDLRFIVLNEVRI